MPGLTLTEEYRDLRTILRLPGGNPFSVRRETVQVGGTRHHVTAILVLFGLPRLLTGSILAHETTHVRASSLPCCKGRRCTKHSHQPPYGMPLQAWLRMSGFAAHRHLRPQVEEGLCQLIALLWLEAQQAAGFKDAYEERLAAYLGHCIRTDQSEVYGEGFRMAHEAFQQHGLAAVLAAVRQTGELPPTAP